MLKNILDDGISAKIKSSLTEIGCCERCILRFMDERDSEKYLEIKTMDEPEAKKAKPNTCITCLGILIDLSDLSNQKVINDEISKDREFDDFVLSLNVPTCVLFRQYLVLMHMKRNFPSVYENVNSTDLILVKDAWKWIIAAHLVTEQNKLYSTTSAFSINIVLSYEENQQECIKFWEVYDQNSKNATKKRRKMSEIESKSAIQKALTEFEKIDSFPDKLLKALPLIPKMGCEIKEIACSHATVYLAGRYNKYSRRLPQTPWINDSERVIESSVQELICKNIMPHILADDIRFTSSGREDVDVRTLGKGRPFVLQFINPRKVKLTPEALSKIQDEVNESTSDIAIRDLQVVAKDALNILKLGEETKTKTYTCKCYSIGGLQQADLDRLSTFKDLVLYQKTPIRVLHRRTLAEREKIVHNMMAKFIDSHHFQLTLLTQAGTYIKEFVHGDFGRTKPNLGEILGTELDILELDVESINQEWPPAIDK